MTCYYHADHPATAVCQACGHPLCPACDHRIKGAPYCQDCIVAGIDLLRSRGSGVSTTPFWLSPLPDSADRLSRARSPWLALICAILFPGLGALYNGQPIKALLQFLTMLGLLTMVDLLSSPLDDIFGLGLIACYLSTILDSYRSAWRSRVERGSLQVEDERLRERIRQHPQTIGILLISLGILALLEHLAPTLLERFWPLLFIVAGYVWISRSTGAKRHPGSSSL